MRTSQIFSRALVASFLFMPPATMAQERSPVEIAALVRPALVSVSAMDGGEYIGQGSGFFVAADGVLVTNYHVVEGADQIEVGLQSGEIFDQVYVVAADPRRDVAVLRIPVADVPFLALGDDRALSVGERLYTMGNPRGLEGTFSDGLLSGRRMLDGVSLVQMSTPISPGSSGGPVMNASGEVVGIATLSMRDSQNLNLAVPSRYAPPLIELAGPPQLFTEWAAQLPTPEPSSRTSEVAASSSGQAGVAYIGDSLIRTFYPRDCGLNKVPARRQVRFWTIKEALDAEYRPSRVGCN